MTHMVPGEYFLLDAPIELNEGRATRRLDVTNRGDRPVQVGSHCHFFEVNRFWVAVHALKALADEGEIPAEKVAEAIKKYGLDSEKPNPVTV